MFWVKDLWLWERFKRANWFGTIYSWGAGKTSLCFWWPIKKSSLMTRRKVMSKTWISQAVALIRRRWSYPRRDYKAKIKDTQGNVGKKQKRWRKWEKEWSMEIKGKELLSLCGTREYPGEDVCICSIFRAFNTSSSAWRGLWKIIVVPATLIMMHGFW